MLLDRPLADAEPLPQLPGGEPGLGAEHLQQLQLPWGGHLRTDLRTHLRTGRCGSPLRPDRLLQSVLDRGEEVRDERLQLSLLIGLAQALVVPLLPGPDHLLDRQPGQQRSPPAEDEGLPEAAEAAVAIGEGVNELQLVMHDATGQQRMPVAALQPAEQVSNQGRDSRGRGRHVHQCFPPVDPDAAAAEAARAIHQARHQQAVGFQQVLLIAGIPAGQGLVGADGIAHLLNVAGRAKHPLAVEEGRDLLQAEAVPLDRQRGLDGVDAILMP